MDGTFFLDPAFCNCHLYTLTFDEERKSWAEWYGPDGHHIRCSKSDHWKAKEQAEQERAAAHQRLAELCAD